MLRDSPVLQPIPISPIFLTEDGGRASIRIETNVVSHSRVPHKNGHTVVLDLYASPWVCGGRECRGPRFSRASTESSMSLTILSQLGPSAARHSGTVPKTSLNT